MNVFAVQRWELRAGIVTAYGGVGVIVLAYTALLLVTSGRYLAGWVAVPAVMSSCRVWWCR